MFDKIKFKIRYLKIKLFKLKWCINIKKEEKRYIENDIKLIEEYFLNRGNIWWK